MARAALFALLPTVAAKGTVFHTVGDWGGAALGGSSAYASTTVHKVASAMVDAAKAEPIDFVISLGDHWYWCGIQNTSDFQIQKDWVEPFQSDASLKVPWYTVLGNHEYGYNVEANLQLTKNFSNWIADDRYYSKRIALGDGKTYMTLIVIDTSPCVSDYRSDAAKGWDPCSTQYPTCSFTSGTDSGEGPCKFHENILAQDCQTQATWFTQTLEAVPKDDWLVVAGHHPIDECDVVDMTTIMQKHGFDFYMNGHTHTLAHYDVDGDSAYMTSGAGSLVETDDQHQGATAQKLAAFVDGANITAPQGHTFIPVWSSKTAGFSRHTFSDDYQTLTNEMVSYEGKVLHSWTIKKGSAPVPGPTPAPGNKCCYYHDTNCQKGWVCCKSGCTDPASCSYTEDGCYSKYGQAHHCTWTSTECVVGGNSSAY